MNNLLKVLGLLSCMVPLLLTSCEIELNEKTYKVKYEVTGSADMVDITMSNAGGDTEQLDNVTLPWSKSFTVTVKRYHHFFPVFLHKIREHQDL